MSDIRQPWDYLIITASNITQASAYKFQLNLRKKLGSFLGIERVLVVPDPMGRRIGSGGSTLFSLLKVLNQESRTSSLDELSPARIEEILSRLRILIIHAGGDSRRLPAYGPFGKIFIPIPGKLDSPLGNTIFDRQFPIYRKLPPNPSGKGQVVVTTGDVLLFFPPEDVIFRGSGITGLGCSVSPAQAKNHGVFSANREEEVQFFLQKPTISEQRKKGAIDGQGKVLLDIGIMEMDPAFAVKLVTLVNIEARNGKLCWTGPIANEILCAGLDFYRDICCAMGKKARFDRYLKNVRASGSQLSESFLLTLFDTFSKVPFQVHALKDCRFFHFGTPRQLIETGSELRRLEKKTGTDQALLTMNNAMGKKGRISGTNSWVEGCRISSELELEGENVVVGVSVDRPLSLPAKTCLDVIKGKNRRGKKAWFVRVYGIDDSFKAPVEKTAELTNSPLREWLIEMGFAQKDMWEAKIFPAVSSPNTCHEWLWMANPREAKAGQIQAWQNADKYSLAEMAKLADLDDFDKKRRSNRFEQIRQSLGKAFELESSLSAEDLAFILEELDEIDRAGWIRDVLKEARHHVGKNKKRAGIDRLIFSRATHTLGTAVQYGLAKNKKRWNETLQAVQKKMPQKEIKRWEDLGLDIPTFQEAAAWCAKLKEIAFENLSRTIVRSTKKSRSHPQCAVRSDAIIWGRAPARLDLGGGWTDTPPYALEHGGCVINAAVDLNGQPPIHVYARVVDEPVLRITSIDHGVRLTIRNLKDLMDYRRATSEFGLAKAALVLSGFSLATASWPKDTKTLEDMLRQFGGGIELTTLAAIPSGSGLGTSSIMGAVLLSVISRLMGRKTGQRQLFNMVLQLEQELTTGGGWQDQIGGTVGGVKIITTKPGLVPDPEICPVKSDVLDPSKNRGQTLLYYTGMRRLAKNILRNIVGRYLDRNQRTMDTLGSLHAFPALLIDTLERREMEKFGDLIGRALHLKKEIDPDSSNPAMEKILDKFRPYMIGATFLGAGGGGFLLVVCKSPQDAVAARNALAKDPPNPLARFFDYEISATGLEVTVC
jgi:fucokinase